MTHATATQTSLEPATLVPPSTRRGRRREGIVSLLAILFMVLFGALALGFYASTTMSAQVSRNDRFTAESQLAAESGMQFMRYYLGSMDLPTSTNSTNLMANVRAELGRMLDGQFNMQGESVRIVDDAIHIPGRSIALDSAGNRKFHATITQSGAFLIVTIYGGSRDLLVPRAVQMKYQQAPRASAIFNYGVATRGTRVTGGSAVIVGLGDPARGSVLSTNMTAGTPVIIGGKEVSGDISITNPYGDVSYAGAKIGGTMNTMLIEREHIHRGVASPDFPDVDSSEFAKYAVNQYVSGKTLDNAYIPPGMNPQFTAGADITGVLLVKAPNRVKFGGSINIRGVIVVENGAAVDLTNNRVEFAGNVTAYGVETLPESYGDLRKLTGAFILAPSFAVSFTGSFGVINGSILSSEINFTGSAAGVIKGSIINLNDRPMTINGSSEITIASTGTSNYPTGVSFGKKYTPLPDTYRELAAGAQ